VPQFVREQIGRCGAEQVNALQIAAVLDGLGILDNNEFGTSARALHCAGEDATQVTRSANGASRPLLDDLRADISAGFDLGTQSRQALACFRQVSFKNLPLLELTAGTSAEQPPFAHAVNLLSGQFLDLDGRLIV
jgi:hypothetical protein